MAKRKTKPHRKPDMKLASWLGYNAQELAKEYVQSELDNVSRRVSLNYMAMTLLVMHDELGFGRKRCLRIWARVADMADALEKGLITFDDIRETLRQEVKIDLENEQVQRDEDGGRWDPV